MTSLAVAALVVGLALASGGVALQGLLLGLALALLAVFGMIWALGIRYPDVGWTLGLIAFAELAAVSPFGGVSRFALVLAMGAFLLSFFRVPVAPGRLEAVFAGLVGAFALARAFLPDAARLAVRLDDALPSYVAAVLLAYAGVFGVVAARGLPAKRRRYIGAVSGACAVGAGLNLAHGKAGFSAEFALRVDFALVTAFSLFIVADLVVFHRSYFKEKAARMVQARQGDIEARLELGRSVQELILSKERSGRFGGFTYEFHFQPAATKGADWFFAAERGSEKRFFLGEVLGDGPQGGLAVAAIIGFLHDVRVRELDLVGTARLVDERLAELFSRDVSSTFMAVSADRDGTVELLNCGGPGFFSVSRDGCRHWAMPSPPVGAGEGVEGDVVPVPLEDGDVLFAGNGGLLGPDARAKVLAHFEDDMDLALDAGHIRAAVIAAARPAPADHQTLLTLQKTVAAA